MTGTGKTDILYALAEQGEQILDLEQLANHRGSSYGSLGLPAQPTNEQFENQIAMQWANLNDQQPVWIEAESRRIGMCRVPNELFLPMMQAPVVQIERSRPERIALLLQVYGTADPQGLVAATERLRKRLGGLRTQQTVELILRGELAQAIDIVLDYYDKTYCYDLQQRNVPVHALNVSNLSPTESACLLIEKMKQTGRENLFNHQGNGYGNIADRLKCTSVEIKRSLRTEMNLNLSENKLQIELEWFEQLWAFTLNKTIEIPLPRITRVTTEEPQSNWSEIRAPGTFLPGVIKAGTYYTRRGREFWYVTDDKNYLTLEIDNEYYKRIVLTFVGNEVWADRINQSKSGSEFL